MFETTLSLGEIELLVTTVGYISSVIIIVGTGIFVLAKSTRREVRISFFLFTLSYAVFLISHIAGINAPTAEKAHFFFMFNMNNVFLLAFAAHWLIAMVSKPGEYRTLFCSMYTTSTLLVSFYLFFPHLFMEGAEPVLYFPYYYKIGSFYFLTTIFQTLFIGIATYLAWKAYRNASDYPTKKRMFYFLIMPLIGYPLGFLPVFPLYGILIDPIASIFLWAWMIPLGYGIIKDDLLDIRIIAKRAFIYLGLVAVSTVGLVIVNTVSVYLLQRYESFPIWVIPAVSSFFGIGIAVTVWQRLRQTDILKYEFINVITHKFRTPMTYIKFSLEELRSDNASQEIKGSALERIEIANSRLIDLTNVLVEAAQSEHGNYMYANERLNINTLIEETLYAQRGDVASKLITIENKLSPEINTIAVDKERTKSVIQILLENAITYSPKGGTVRIETRNEGHHVVLSVTDNGIGMTRDELKLLFNKFYRTTRATSADTEGMGIGLFIAKNIIERQGGRIWATSPGKNLGSTFHLSFPALELRKRKAPQR